MRFYMSRHGESLNNTLDIIGGDCNITDRGHEYSQYLSNYFKDIPVTVWTSKLQRTIETSKHINGTKLEWGGLNEIYSGDVEGMTLFDIQKLHPKMYEFRNSDKLNNKYPNGESYVDLQKRVYKVLDTIDTSSDDTLLIIAHKAVCRIIYSYFTDTSVRDCTDIKIDLHTLYKLDSRNFFPVL